MPSNVTDAMPAGKVNTLRHAANVTQTIPSTVAIHSMADMTDGPATPPTSRQA